MWKECASLVTVLGVVISNMGGAQERSSTGDFDLVSQQRDPNGLLLNPRWRTQEHPLSLDPAKRCGILGLKGAPGYRPVLLRNPDCFGEKQRSILRLNEPRRFVAAGIACGQTVNDGSPQGHLNWVPVTMEGTIIFNDKKSGFGGDFDLTFEFVGDSRAPSTKWNSKEELRSKFGPERSPIHVEFDYRETTDRLDSAVERSWWTEFAEAADSHEKANELLGIGRAVVTGLFNVDLVHYGHSEIHPIFGLAVLVRADTIGQTRIRHQWVFLARDRGNQGNCAVRGMLPFRLETFPDSMSKYRFRILAPDGASGAPRIATDDSWIGVSKREMRGPDFAWSSTEGLQVEVQWPQPSRNGSDAVLMGDLTLEWSGDFADTLLVGAFANAVTQSRAVRSIELENMGPEYYEHESKEFFDDDATFYEHLSKIETWTNWSDSVTEVQSLPTAPELPLMPAEIFDRVPPVLSCALVKKSENPRCLGHWAVAPIIGVDPTHPPLDENFVVGISFENVRHYLGGPVLRWRYSLSYVRRQARDSGGVDLKEHILVGQPEFVIGPIRNIVTIYGIIGPGVGVRHTDRLSLSGFVAAGVGFPIRTGYQVGSNVELVHMFRWPGSNYFELSLRIPIAF